jgi:hypothetical protein
MSSTIIPEPFDDLPPFNPITPEEGYDDYEDDE